MERIIIANEPVDVPPDVVTEGREAVQAWHRQQLEAKGIAFTVAENGDPIVTPAAAASDVLIAADSPTDQE